MRVIVNRQACSGYGVCAEICPEIYKLDDKGIVFVEQELVPPGLEIAAREGAEACPQSALAVAD